jgi:hypothetical protein
LVVSELASMVAMAHSMAGAAVDIVVVVVVEFG